MLAQLGRGVTWTYTSMGISGVLQIGVVAATARLLPAEAFGLVAMANVILHFCSYFAQMGVGRALIQRTQIGDLDVRAAFTSSLLLGLVASLTVIAVAPAAAVYYQSEDVIAVMRWLSVSFVVSGIGVTGRALLQRRLNFRATGAIEVASYAFGYAVPTLVLAANGFGVWSLVGGAIGQVTFSTTALVVLTRHSMRPTFRFDVHRRLLGFGAKVSAISVMEFLGSSLDTLVIGRFGTPTQLGLYNRAFMLASLPPYQVHHGIAKVLFPVLSSGRSDPREFNRALEAATGSAIKLIMPLGIGMGLAAPELVRVVLGEAWVEIIPVFAVLAPALALNLISALPGQALDALGRLRWKALVQFAYVILLGSALVFAAADAVDLSRIARLIAIGVGLRTVAIFFLTHQCGAVPRSYLVSTLRTTLVASAVTSVTFTAVLALLRTLHAPLLLTFAASLATGGFVLFLLFGRSIVRFWSERSGGRCRGTRHG